MDGAATDARELVPRAPVLLSASLDADRYVLTFELPAGSLPPEGGFDTYIDGVDQNDTADHDDFSRTIEGLDTRREHCFSLEARYTQLDPEEFLRSNERCVSPTDGPVVWTHRKAFPSLYGEGADAITGGRGGIKFFVTTLSSEVIQTHVPASEGVEEHFEGSLSGALTLDRPREVIPRVAGNVAGTIEVALSRFDDLTYHGHLGPGGIAVVRGSVSFARVDNIVLRYLTVRRGPDAAFGNDDALALNRVSHVAVDHCSVGWAGDEASTVFAGTSEADESIVYGPIIYQRNIFGQGVDGHDRGMILGSSPLGPSGDVTANVHLNFWVVAARTPVAVGEERTVVRSANSVIYNWNGRTTNLLRRPSFDEVANYYKPGPLTVSPIAGHFVNKYQDQGQGPPSIYTAGNLVEGLLMDPAADNRVIWTRFDPDDARGMDDDPLPDAWFRSEPLPIQPEVGYVPVSAMDALASVIGDEEVGNNRSTNASGETVRHHDAIDARYLAGFAEGTDPRLPMSEWIDPERPATEPYPDANWNGIDDAFEEAHGITSADEVIRDWSFGGLRLRNDAGYTAFEVWSAVRAGALEVAPR